MSINSAATQFNEDWDFNKPGEYERATNYYAGPFCSCGDYSCPVMNDPTAECVNRETPGYLEHYTDEELEHIALQELLGNIDGDNSLDAELAAHRINQLGDIDTGCPTCGNNGCPDCGEIDRRGAQLTDH